MRIVLCLCFFACFLVAKPNNEDYQKIEKINNQALNLFAIKEMIFNFETSKKEPRIYKIFIAKPKISMQKQGLKQRPKRLFIMLDANKQFPMLLNLYAQNHSLNTDFIILGIGYDTELGYDKVQRTRDYTPKVAQKTFEQGGGANDFFDFLRSEILPFMKKNYRIDEDNIALFGHSFGGLFTLNSLVNQDIIFTHYFIASPSLWWGEASFLPQKLKLSKCPKINIMQGSKEAQRSKIKENTAYNLSKRLESESSCKVSYKLFENETHGSVIAKALLFSLKEFLKD